MSEVVFEIPFEAVPQRFAIDLAGRDVLIINRWNAELATWMLDILDGATEVPLIASLPLVTGVDLLSQHAHLGLGGQMVVQIDGTTVDQTPTLDNLGTLAHVHYRTL